MKKKIYIFIVMLIVVSLSAFLVLKKQSIGAELNQAPKQLTLEEKIEDFNHMFKIISENYPYLEVNKRMNGIDWVSKKEIYLNEVKQTKTDEEFFNALNNILGKLHNNHTQMMPKEFLEWILPIYINSPSSWSDWRNLSIETLTNEQVLRRYGIDKSFVQDNSGVEGESQSVINAGAYDIVKNKVAYITIPKMIPSSQMERDKKLLDYYLNKIKNYQTIVIDIRGNGGGDSRYWSDYLVPKIANKPLEFNTYEFFRKGEIVDTIRNYKLLFNLENLKTYKKVSDLNKNELPKLPPEVSKDFYYYIKNNGVISPTIDSIKFKGKIYLLVDEKVYSSSEMLAVFAKNSKFATLIGEKTGGDGIGSDPWIEKLPNSGYVFRFSKEMGTSGDGTCNEENKTIPDYIIDNPVKNYKFKSDECIQQVLKLENINM